MHQPGRTTSVGTALFPFRRAAAGLLCLGAMGIVSAQMIGVAAAQEPKATSPAAGAPVQALPPGVFARINGQDVSMSQFLNELSDVLGESYKETYVTHVLLDEKAKAVGVDATPEEIAVRLQESVDRVLKDNFGGDLQRMNEALKDRGLTMDGWKKRLKIDARYDILLDKLIRKERKVPEENLRHLFEAEYGVGGVQTSLRHILKNVQVGASQDYTLQQYEQNKSKIDEEALARAQEALRKLNEGKPFEVVMMAYSDDPRRMQGGSIGSWKGRFGQDLDDAAAKLAKGQHSGVVKCPDGYRIVECTDVTQTEEIHASHILIAVGARGKGRTDAEAKTKADALLAQIKAGADFAKLAKDNSDDPGSAARGGDLGWFGRRVMAKPFEDAAFAMQPGSFSSVPVKTNFGYHIIKVQEKRTVEEKALRQILVGTQYASVKERMLRPVLEAKARETLQGLQAQASRPGGSFAEIAKSNSDDAVTKGDGGLIKSYREGLYGGEFDLAVKSMKAGDPPVIVLDANGNLHLVMVDEVVKTDYDTVRGSLLNEELASPPTPQEKSEYVAKLRESATVVF